MGYAHSNSITQPRTKSDKSSIAQPNQDTDVENRFRASMNNLDLNNVKPYIDREAEYAKTKPPLKASAVKKNTFIWFVNMGNNFATVAEAGMELLKKKLPTEFIKLIDKAKKDIEKDPSVEFTDIQKTTQMGGDMKEPVKRFSRTLFILSYIPAVLTLLAFFFLLFVLLWAVIQGLLHRFLGDKYGLPNIRFNTKTTQTVYSIFFVITSWFLMLYLFVDYFRDVGPELDIVQIFKQLIGASYILWPMAILIIGSGISKAFYKISCNGNKPNVLSWAKIVETSALYVLGIAAAITVFFLIKPIKILYEKIPLLVKYRFSRLKVGVAVTLKLMVIYILLRMITIMIENIISNKIVFFISKLNKDVEAPPIDCNVEETKNAKQSEIAKILEEIYMYISGIIVCLIIILIVVIQCPHPWIKSTMKINNTIGSVFLQLTGITTRFIVENKDGKKDCNEKKKGLNNFSSFGKTGPQYSEQKLPEASTADAKDAEIQANDRKLGATQDEQRAQIARALAEGRAQALAQENTRGTVAEYSRLLKGSTPASAPSESASASAPSNRQPTQPTQPAPPAQPIETTTLNNLRAPSKGLGLQVLPAIPRGKE